MISETSERSIHMLLLSDNIILNNYWMRFFDIQINQGRGRDYQPKPKVTDNELN